MTEPDDTSEDTRIGALYRRSLSEEPPAALDRAVLDAARAALPRRRYRSPVPWAVAATLVLGAGIGWQLLQLDPAQVMPVSAPRVEAPLPPRADSDPPAAQRSSGTEAAPARAPSDVAPKSMLREAAPSHGASLEAERVRPYSASPPAASPQPGPDECEPHGFANDAPLQALHDAIDAARQAGDSRRVLCLEQQLRQRQEGSAEPAESPQAPRDR